MARRKLTIVLEPIVAGAVAGGSADDVDEEILDATAALLLEHGLGRWSVEDVADGAGLGRTSVYRRFPSKDDLVHGVLARELRRTVVSVGRAAAEAGTVEDKVVEGALVALAALEGSVVDRLLQSDPATILPFLTTGAGPLIDLARRAFAPALVAAGVAGEGPPADLLAESMARLGLSFVLTRSTALPVQDPIAMRAAVATLVGPLFQPQ